MAFWTRRRSDPNPPDAGISAGNETAAAPATGRADEIAEPHVPWTTLQTSSLFSWFGLSEVSRHSTWEGAWVTIEPEAFRDFIDLGFELDSGENVVGFQIAFDRNWLDAPGIAMASAADLTKSVLECLAVVDPVLADVANGLMPGALRASQTTVITAIPLREPLGGSDIEALVNSFTNFVRFDSVVQGKRLLCARNLAGASPRGAYEIFVLSWGHQTLIPTAKVNIWCGEPPPTPPAVHHPC